MTTSGADTFFMAVPPVLSDLVGACHARNASGQGGRTADQSSTRFRTTSGGARHVPKRLSTVVALARATCYGDGSTSPPSGMGPASSRRDGPSFEAAVRDQCTIWVVPR